ncbi:DUF2145 domain-containing protein [Yoonia sp. GPGPB17]|uniref:DUF2145 domain-containing protein n=1 Tax=Yoonia sp. GPGPB17 TaxID=3026147 RepID=UPI0030C13DDC
MTRILTAVLLLVMTLFPIASSAGSSAAGNPILPAQDVAAFSNKVQRDLAARGANVAIVSRVGRDPAVLPDGINYTHVAFWVYSRITQADGSTGTGYRVYNLYQREGDLTQSDLVQDTPADFFLLSAHSLDAGIIIPDPRLQRQLIDVIASPTYAALHNSRYSVLANPRSGQFQNCTEHTLDVLMAALYDTSDPAQIKANIAAYFTPQPVPLNGLQRLFALSCITSADNGRSWGERGYGHVRVARALH